MDDRDERERGAREAREGIYQPPSDPVARQLYEEGRAQAANAQQTQAYHDTVVNAASSASAVGGATQSDRGGAYDAYDWLAFIYFGPVGALGAYLTYTLVTSVSFWALGAFAGLFGFLLAIGGAAFLYSGLPIVRPYYAAFFAGAPVVLVAIGAVQSLMIGAFSDFGVRMAWAAMAAVIMGGLTWFFYRRYD